MTRKEIIDNLELYTVGRPKKDRVSITVEELQNLIDEIKALEQQPSNVCEYNRGYRDGYDKGNLNGYEIRKAEEKKSNDCVSRAEVRKIAKEMYLEVANMDLDVHTISDCISYTSSKCRQVLEKKLQALPPATPTDEGVWVEERDDYGKVNAWHCSNCYERTGFYTDYASNFCLECGVKKIGIVKSDEEAKKFLEKRGNENDRYRASN